MVASDAPLAPAAAGRTSTDTSQPIGPIAAQAIRASMLRKGFLKYRLQSLILSRKSRLKSLFEPSDAPHLTLARILQTLSAGSGDPAYNHWPRGVVGRVPSRGGVAPIQSIRLPSRSRSATAQKVRCAPRS